MVYQAGASMAQLQLQEMLSGSKEGAHRIVLQHTAPQLWVRSGQDGRVPACILEHPGCQLPLTLSWQVLGSEGLSVWVQSLESWSKSENPSALNYTPVSPLPKLGLVVKHFVGFLFAVRNHVSHRYSCFLAVHTAFGLFTLCSTWSAHQLPKCTCISIWMPVGCQVLSSNCALTTG